MSKTKRSYTTPAILSRKKYYLVQEMYAGIWTEHSLHTSKTKAIKEAERVEREIVKFDDDSGFARVCAVEVIHTTGKKR